VRVVFLDTVGLIAVWDEDDQWHGAAAAVFDELVRERSIFITTTYVLAECANAAARRPYRSAVVELHRALDVRGQVIAPDEVEWRNAWSRYAADHPGGPGLVDQLSFAVMQRLRIRRAFTNDRHFATAGFEALF
jgi:uncharacterized protein